MSVMNMIEAMKKASGFDYKYEIIGRRTGGAYNCCPFLSVWLILLCT